MRGKLAARRPLGSEADRKCLDGVAGGSLRARELHPLPCSQLAATQPIEAANGATTSLGDRVASMTTLVTGFEPFGGSKVNSSELVVTALAALGELGVITAVLPTSYRRAEARIGDLFRAHRPRTVLMLGLAENAARICLEQVALNLDDSDAPDNDGEVRLRQRIVEGAPVGYWSSLQLDRMAEAARDLGEEVVFSHDAGGYVCSHVFFMAAHLVATEFLGSRCGFVHLPAVQGSGERLTRLLDIVRIWIAEQ